MSEKPGFENALAELESRVRKLEAGEVTLDEALQLFEEGVSLANSCHEQLDAAEDRISSLSRGQAGIQSTSLPEPKGE
jgi:exodeoxyribonuclease VII small subunit